MSYEEFEAKRSVLVALEQVSKFYPSLIAIDPHYAVDLYLMDAGRRHVEQKEQCHAELEKHDNSITATIAGLSASLDGGARLGSPALSHAAS